MMHKEALNMLIERAQDLNKPDEKYFETNHGTSQLPRLFPVAKTITRKSFIGRNDLCPCGSGKKYKVCCLLKININLMKS